MDYWTTKRQTVTNRQPNEFEFKFQTINRKTFEIEKHFRVSSARRTGRRSMRTSNFLYRIPFNVNFYVWNCNELCKQLFANGAKKKKKNNNRQLIKFFIIAANERTTLKYSRISSSCWRMFHSSDARVGSTKFECKNLFCVFVHGTNRKIKNDNFSNQEPRKNSEIQWEWIHTDGVDGVNGARAGKRKRENNKNWDCCIRLSQTFLRFLCILSLSTSLSFSPAVSCLCLTSLDISMLLWCPARAVGCA